MPKNTETNLKTFQQTLIKFDKEKPSTSDENIYLIEDIKDLRRIATDRSQWLYDTLLKNGHIAPDDNESEIIKKHLNEMFIDVPEYTRPPATVSVVWYDHIDNVTVTDESTKTITLNHYCLLITDPDANNVAIKESHIPFTVYLSKQNPAHLWIVNYSDHKGRSLDVAINPDKT